LQHEFQKSVFSRKTLQILSKMKHSGFLPEPTLMIDELGFPERGRSQEEIIEFWDRLLEVFFAHNIPLIFC